jgi:hypothetical protein
MKAASHFIHFMCMIEQPNVCEDGAEMVVRVRQIVLQAESTLECCDRLQVLEVSRMSPQQKRSGHVSLREFRPKFESPLTVELRLFQPSIGWIEFEMTSCTGKGKRVAWARANSNSNLCGVREEIARTVRSSQRTIPLVGR